MLSPTPDQVKEITQIGMERAPEEACGIIVRYGSQDKVIEIPNVAENRWDSYQLCTDSLDEVVIDIAKRQGHCLHSSEVIIWHTHPGGGVGPSKSDIDGKQPGFSYLVVTIPDGKGVVF